MHRETRPVGPHLPRRLLTASVFAALAALAGRSLIEHPRADTPGPCDPPNSNQIVCENQQPGNLPSEWDIQGAGDSTIQGFATAISVNRGQVVSFKIDTDAVAYQLDIYRMGYYDGMGA